MTPTQQAAYTRGLIEAGGGDATMIAGSYATVDRARRHVVKDLATLVYVRHVGGASTLHSSLGWQVAADSQQPPSTGETSHCCCR